MGFVSQEHEEFEYKSTRLGTRRCRMTTRVLRGFLIIQMDVHVAIPVVPGSSNQKDSDEETTLNEHHCYELLSRF